MVVCAHKFFTMLNFMQSAAKNTRLTHLQIRAHQHSAGAEEDSDPKPLRKTKSPRTDQKCVKKRGDKFKNEEEVKEQESVASMYFTLKIGSWHPNTLILLRLHDSAYAYLKNSIEFDSLLLHPCQREAESKILSLFFLNSGFKNALL